MLPCVDHCISPPYDSNSMRHTNYTVEIKKDGIGGWVSYGEGRQRLLFEWDFHSHGIEIYTPPPSEWDAFCEEHAARWAKDRRREILERIAQEYCRQKVRKAEWRIEDHR